MPGVIIDLIITRSGINNRPSGTHIVKTLFRRRPSVVVRVCTRALRRLAEPRGTGVRDCFPRRSYNNQREAVFGAVERFLMF